MSIKNIPSIHGCYELLDQLDRDINNSKTDQKNRVRVTENEAIIQVLEAYKYYATSRIGELETERDEYEKQEENDNDNDA